MKRRIEKGQDELDQLEEEEVGISAKSVEESKSKVGSILNGARGHGTHLRLCGPLSLWCVRTS